MSRDPAQRALRLGMGALAATAAKNEGLMDELMPVVYDCARKAGAAGITVADVRITAVQRGILTGGENTSFLGALMRRAGLRNTGQLRRSHVLATHAHHNTVWVLPDTL